LSQLSRSHVGLTIAVTLDRTQDAKCFLAVRGQKICLQEPEAGFANLAHQITHLLKQ
jgi:hypothetical protein